MKDLFSLFSITFIVVASYSTSIAQSEGTVPDSLEALALRDIFTSLGGEGWTNNTNWPDSNNWPHSPDHSEFDTWYGITVINGDVTEIKLRNNGLTGNVPISLSSLSTLTYFDISQNQVSGSIPDIFTYLPNLIWVYINSNDLGGEIPITLGGLDQLRHLYLNNNNLTGEIPPALGSMSSLQHLILGGNSLSGGLPLELGGLSALLNLNVSKNNLSGPLPDELFMLTNLRTLALNQNMFEGQVSPEIKNLTKLDALYLYNNSFTGKIPVETGQLTLLSKLRLDNNELSGEIPEELGNLLNLKDLYLSNNNFSGQIPESLGFLPNITHIYLSDNKLNGSLPVGLKDLVSLLVINLKYNDISDIPNFSEHANKHNIVLEATGNRLTPSAIEKNLSSQFTSDLKGFYYNMQGYSGSNFFEVDINSPIIITSIDGGLYGSYLWEKYNESTLLWDDVTPFNESLLPEEFQIGNPSVNDFGQYRVTITNTWINQVFTSGPINVVQYTGRILFSIQSGDWDDVQTWSSTENGASANVLPKHLDTIIIKGHQINCEGENIYRNLFLQQTINPSKLEVNGKVEISGVVDIEQGCSQCDIIVSGSGKIAVQQVNE